MFAIVQLGNQQFKVKVGDFIRVPYQKLSPGEEIEVPVLGFGDEDQFVFSAEKLKKSKVKAVLLRQSLSKKILVFKKKRRKGYRRTKGHRQKISEMRVLELCSPDGKVSKVAESAFAKKKSSDKKTGNKQASGKTNPKKENQVKPLNVTQATVKEKKDFKAKENKKLKTAKTDQTKEAVSALSRGKKSPSSKATKSQATKSQATVKKIATKKTAKKKVTGLKTKKPSEGKPSLKTAKPLKK